MLYLKALSVLLSLKAEVKRFDMTSAARRSHTFLRSDAEAEGPTSDKQGLTDARRL